MIGAGKYRSHRRPSLLVFKGFPDFFEPAESHVAVSTGTGGGPVGQ